MAEHGTFTCYRRGCRRPECRAANARRARELRAKRRAQAVPEHVHGTVDGYRNWGCLCDRCKIAGSVRNHEGHPDIRFWTPAEDVAILEAVQASPGASVRATLRPVAEDMSRSLHMVYWRYYRLVRGEVRYVVPAYTRAG